MIDPARDFEIAAIWFGLGAAGGWLFGTRYGFEAGAVYVATSMASPIIDFIKRIGGDTTEIEKRLADLQKFAKPRNRAKR